MVPYKYEPSPTDLQQAPRSGWTVGASQRQEAIWGLIEAFLTLIDVDGGSGIPTAH